MTTINDYLGNKRFMTVKQLREQLERFDDDAVVVTTYTASDYWRSPLAQPVSSVSESEVFYTEYHRCAQERDYDKDHNHEFVRVVAIG
jgi:hypothetical protein